MKRNSAIVTLLVLLVALVALPVFAGSQKSKKPVMEKAETTVKATITAIDHDTRIVTLQDSKGNYEDIYAGPQIKRFNDLKVGDKVTFKYTESIVYQIKKPGEATPPSGTSEPAIAHNATAKPSGTVSQQTTATVTIKSADPKAGSVTVETEDGRTMSFKVKDKGKLKGLNPGDKVAITYTEAIAVSVE